MVGRFRRIAVVGISGSGKTTLSRRLAAATGLPLIHLDREHWLPGWQAPPRAEWRARVAALAANDAWVMDGNYGGTLDLRLARADAIIWLDYPALRCIVRVVLRTALSLGRTRDDMAAGCRERLDLAFLAYVWRFPKHSRPNLEETIGMFAQNARLFRLTRDAEWAPTIALLAGA